MYWFYAIDKDGFLLSRVRLTMFEILRRNDIVSIEPPAEDQTYRAQFYEGAWRLVPRMKEISEPE